VKEINSQEEINGSNPYLCAHLEENSIRFETDGYQRTAKAVKAGTRRRRPMSTTASSFNDTAVVYYPRKKKNKSEDKKRRLSKEKKIILSF
jgi:hypothetical protein